MSDLDPCQGCRHLVVLDWPYRPQCARGANYGDARCRRERAPAGAAPIRRDAPMRRPHG